MGFLTLLTSLVLSPVSLHLAVVSVIMAGAFVIFVFALFNIWRLVGWTLVGALVILVFAGIWNVFMAYDIHDKETQAAVQDAQSALTSIIVWVERLVFSQSAFVK